MKTVAPTFFAVAVAWEGTIPMWVLGVAIYCKLVTLEGVPRRVEQGMCPKGKDSG